MSEACDGAHPRRIRLRVAYHGARFHGWQIQRDVRTVEGVVTEAVARIAGGPRKVWGASRTDAGVHARGQVCCFDAPTEGAASERSVEAFFKGLNHLTPRDVAVMEVDEVPHTFHPRHSSRGKIYRYQLVDGFLAEPMLRDRVWHVPRPLDVDAMRVAAAALIGEHDFSAFRAAGCDAASPVREIFRVDVTRAAGGPGASIVTVEVVGSAFLKYMVRVIVGTLVEVGVGRRPPAWVGQALASRDRSAAGRTAPPLGLTLEHIFYPDAPFGPGPSSPPRVL